jgi:hypothetical protein
VTSVETEIQDIQDGIRAGRYANEASVSQGIILRLLNQLGWKIFDATSVWPEYVLGGGKVDYALCCPPSKPAILIESKNVGRAVGAERQLFEYAFHQGIPMAVLTDGQDWSFFLPGEQGAYHERCVYKLDIVARPLSESAKVLERYLNYDEVAAGRAIENARSDYRAVARSRQIQEALPIAWQQLLADQDEILVELIAERVATICGFKPAPDVVAEFVEHLPMTSSSTNASTAAVAPATTARIARATHEVATESLRKLKFSGLEFQGKRYQEGTAIKTLMRTFDLLSARDAMFLERYAALPKHGRTRRYISRNKFDLYPDRQDLCEEYSESRFGGWWIGTNYSRSTIRHAIELACQVAGLQFGTDLKLI